MRTVTNDGVELADEVAGPADADPIVFVESPAWIDERLRSFLEAHSLSPAEEEAKGQEAEEQEEA